MKTLSFGNDATRSAALADTFATDCGHLELVHGAGQQTGDCRLPGTGVGHVQHEGCRRRSRQRRSRHGSAAVHRRGVDDLVAANDTAPPGLCRRTPFYQHRRGIDGFQPETTWLARN